MTVEEAGARHRSGESQSRGLGTEGPRAGGGHRWHRFIGVVRSPVEDTEGIGRRHRRSTVEDELGRRSWREPRLDG
jgi:hypothetical protein